jgi:hypothetical protein
MKYAEYQVWFHAFNNAITAFAQRTDMTPSAIPTLALEIADIVLKKFKDVKMPETPVGLDGIDLQGLVNQVAQKAIRKT